MASSPRRSITQAFKPRARLLQLLGDQLIGSPRLAVFELVKNAYDADASNVTVRLEQLGTPDAAIVVADDGTGMSLETLRDVWLTPGDDFRELQREEKLRTEGYGRLPLGEKGVGRFAVHKLGDKVHLVTRAKGREECEVDIDWRVLLRSRYLADASVTISERAPQVFKRPRTGTQVRISALRETTWTKRDIRDLYRQVTSISSPFTNRSDAFNVCFEVPGNEDVLRDLPDARTLLGRAPWRFSFEFDGSAFSYTYQFRGVPSVPVDPREKAAQEQLQILPDVEPDDLDPARPPPRRQATKVVADADTLRGIGPLKGEFYVFDRDKEILPLYAEQNLIKRFLNQNGGVRVFRDGIRVYNYGEPGDDWLGLDLRRVQTPTRNISRNIIIGSIDLSLARSSGLREKTNREGFVENAAFSRLRQVVLGALSVFETERRTDKRAIRLATGSPVEGPKGIAEPVDELRRIARAKGVQKELEPALARVEHEYAALRDSFLRAGLSQVGLSLVFHEVERGVAMLARAIEAGQDLRLLRQQAGDLQRVLETSSQLLRRAERKKQSLQNLVRKARDLNLVRFRLHGIKLECPALDVKGTDTEATFAFGLALGALTNLIDNAIYWLRVAHPEGSAGEATRTMFLNVLPDYPDGPAIVVADNGIGFRDPHDSLVEPFFTRRPDGMGLGLYYTNLVMQLNDGRLAFPDPAEVDVPDRYSGAVVALIFQKAR